VTSFVKSTIGEGGGGKMNLSERQFLRKVSRVRGGRRITALKGKNIGAMKERSELQEGKSGKYEGGGGEKEIG